MSKILQNIQQADWWFSTVIVAVLASVIAAYIKDFIPSARSSVKGALSRFLQRRRRMALLRAAIALHLVRKQPAFLAVMAGGVALRFMFFASITAFTMTAPVLLHFYSIHPEYDWPPSPIAPASVPVVWRFASIPLLIITMVTSYKFQDRYVFYRRIYARYMVRHFRTTHTKR